VLFRSSVGIGKEAALDQQKYFLEYEWERLIDLGRKPELELGDSPPWL
jgi:hypothetical protein